MTPSRSTWPPDIAVIASTPRRGRTGTLKRSGRLLLSVPGPGEAPEIESDRSQPLISEPADDGAMVAASSISAILVSPHRPLTNRRARTVIHRRRLLPRDDGYRTAQARGSTEPDIRAKQRAVE